MNPDRPRRGSSRWSNWRRKKEAKEAGYDLRKDDSSTTSSSSSDDVETVAPKKPRIAGKLNLWPVLARTACERCQCPNLLGIVTMVHVFRACSLRLDLHPIFYVGILCH